MVAARVLLLTEHTLASSSDLLLIIATVLWILPAKDAQHSHLGVTSGWLGSSEEHRSNSSTEDMEIAYLRACE